MGIEASGAVSLSDLQSEFGGSHPISFSEYYKNASPSYITGNSENSSIPNSGTSISTSNFRGSAKAYTVTYEIIGAGGAGGYGLNGGYSSTVAQSGTSSTLSGSGITTVTASGGAGGVNANRSPDPAKSPDGAASVYGAGGVSGNNKNSEPPNVGGHAPTTSYGAGGGAAGGDRSSTFDSSGGAGSPGNAGTYLTGTTNYLVPGATISVSIGSKGLGSGGNARGGNGANGYARLQVGNNVQEFTSGGTYTVPSQ